MHLRGLCSDTFLQINDQINTVLNRYEAFKKGDYSFSSNPIPPELGGSSAKTDLSLIDFDDSGPSNSSGSTVQPTDELASLFGPGPATLSGPPMVNTATRPFMSSTQQPQFGSIMLPGTPKSGGSAGTSRVASPNFFGHGNGNGVQGATGASMSMGSLMSQPQRPQQQPHGAPTVASNQPQGKDPFSDLVGLF